MPSVLSKLPSTGQVGQANFDLEDLELGEGELQEIEDEELGNGELGELELLEEGEEELEELEADPLDLWDPAPSSQLSIAVSMSFFSTSPRNHKMIQDVRICRKHPS